MLMWSCGLHGAEYCRMELWLQFGMELWMKTRIAFANHEALPNIFYTAVLLIFGLISEAVEQR